MKSVPLSASSRSAVRRGAVKQLRSAGRIPAVVYGRKAAPQNLEVGEKELQNLLKHSVSENVLVDLTIAGDARPVRLALVQEVQHHPLSRRLLHLDLHEVEENEKASITVPLEAVGEAAGVKLGGILEHVLFKVRVCALPRDLPDVIHVDVSALEIGKYIHLSDVKVPAGVELIGDLGATVFAMAAPVTEAQETAAAAAEGTTASDVEMIKEKKDDDAKAPAKDDKKEKAGEKKK